HLLGFTARHPRIVHALDNEEWPRDLVHAVERRGALHPGAQRRIALVTVFDAAQILAVPGRVLEERGEVRHPDHIHRAADRAVVLGGGHERHVAPVAAPRQDRKSTRLNSSHEWISY